MVLDYLKVKYGDQATIVPRAWFYARYPALFTWNATQKPAFITTYNDAAIRTPVLWGLSPNDFEISSTFLKAGRWFTPNERGVVILSESQANQLGISIAEFISGKPFIVNFMSMPHAVIGIVDDSIERMVSLDGESLLPIRFDLPPELQPNPWNIHVPMKYCLILPYEEVVEMGGSIASISLQFKDSSLINKAAAEFYTTFTYLLPFFCVNEKIYLSRTGAVYNVIGIQSQLVPMTLAILGIFNILLGSVYERKKQIGTYGTIGLSPIHISFMFLAEAIVYALIGGVSGYLVAVVFGKIAGAILPGSVILNYSSSWVFIALGFSAVATILSSFYPMWIASRIVTPSLERLWKIPTKPRLDVWEIPLPFNIRTRSEVEGLIEYISEYIGAHTSRDSPDFFTDSINLTESEMDGKPCISILANNRLLPYDSGVTQTTSLIAIQEAPDRWQFRIILNRTGGATERWIYLNRHFIDMLRKQILLWNSLSEEDKNKYIKFYREKA